MANPRKAVNRGILQQLIIEQGTPEQSPMPRGRPDIPAGYFRRLFPPVISE
jgi:hypothetical protein